MVNTCAAYGCTARAVPGGTRSFHRFPTNPVRRKKWVRATRRKDYTPSSSGSFICSDHFAKDAYDESKTSGFCSRRFLKPDAVPTIFAFPDYLVRKKVKTERELDEKCPQSTANVEVATAADQVDVNNSSPSSSLERIKVEVTTAVDQVDLNQRPPSSSLERIKIEVITVTGPVDVKSKPTSNSSQRIKAPTIQYVVVEPTSGSYICRDHFPDKACDKSQTSGFCSGGYLNLKPDVVPGSLFVYPDRLPPTRVNKRKSPLNQKCSQSTADVETKNASEHVDVNSIPTSSSQESIKAQKLRCVHDCIPNDTDSLTDTKHKLHFVLSAYEGQRKRMKTLMQKVRRTNKRYLSVKDALDELRYNS